MQDDIEMVTWLYPSVTVDLIQRHRVAVVFCFCPSSDNDHGVFDQGCSVEETGQWLQNNDMIQQEWVSYLYARDR